MTIYNVILSNTSSTGSAQSWTLNLESVQINSPDLLYGHSYDSCSLDSDKITSVTAIVNGNVAVFVYTAPSSSGADSDGTSTSSTSGGWSQSGSNPNFTLSPDGNNLTISSSN
ncbi:hypothetical protein [Flexibacterium corallicola]|uniref:hypothetical protein n=1 Tax=Flexibacterium corallicola TaxID=3037259 RepID=UPI00286F04F7|nr:hypothetical protein [Pseudovibrio sp. M1P-2-3]